MITKRQTLCTPMLLTACCALTVTAAAAQALVSVHFVEKTSGQAVVQVPLSGGNYDVAVVLNSDEQVLGVGGAILYVAASQSGLVNLSGRIGGIGSAARGTRYNTPLWSATVDDAAHDPDLIAGPLNTTPRGIYGTTVLTESPFFQQSVMGWLNVKLLPAPAGSSVGIAPTFFVWGSVFGSGDLRPGQIQGGVRFDYVPEPGTALALAVGAGLLRFGSSRIRNSARRGQ